MFILPLRHFNGFSVYVFEKVCTIFLSHCVCADRSGLIVVSVWMSLVSCFLRPLNVTLVFNTKGQRYLRVGLAVPLFGSITALRSMVAEEGKISPDQVTGCMTACLNKTSLFLFLSFSLSLSLSLSLSYSISICLFLSSDLLSPFVQT